jgi:hypothetical protein
VKPERARLEATDWTHPRSVDLDCSQPRSWLKPLTRRGIKMRKAHHDTIRVPGAAGAVSLATAQCTLPYRYAGEEDFFPFLIIFLNLIRFSQISLFDMTYVAVTPVFIFSCTNLFDMTYIAVV